MGVTTWPDSLPLGDPIPFPPKAVLGIEGHRIATLYLVESGVVSLSRRAQGADVVFAYRFAGAALGVCCAIAGMVHGETARTVGEVRAHPVSRSAFLAARRSCARAAAWLEHAIVAEREELVRWSIGLAASTTEERLTTILAMLFRRCSERRPDGSRRLLVSETVEHLATASGVTREHASRVIGNLIKGGVLRRDSRSSFSAPASSILLRPDPL
jgi:CRP-like cAMP-binding protein